MARRARWVRPVAALVALATLAGCSDTTDETTTAKAGADDQTIRLSGDATFAIRGSVEQVSITGAAARTKLVLVDSDDTIVQHGIADKAGSLIFRDVKPGKGYRVADESTRAATDAVEVWSVDGSTPDPEFYSEQQLEEGYQYITTRDGTTLAATVYLPPGDGPFPTVVEYSGYDPANPTQDLRKEVGKLGADPDSVCTTLKIVCHKPAQPASLIAAAAEYAVVAVNIRGTGCSGGAYDYFEPLQNLDGYDVIETVAAQPWVKGGKVGMVGLSYPGIAQLFVASTRPPHLAAITPMSTFDDTARGVVAPGGIFNTGFALKWAQEVLNKARPKGQGWEQTVIDGGDTICGPNQALRGQNVDQVDKAMRNPYYTDEVATPLSPIAFASKIKVPTMLFGAWQDEQTGPSFANLFDALTNAPVRKMIAYNGAHGDGYSPETLVEWKAFLDFYVAGERTPIPGFLRQFGPELIGEAFNTRLEFPDERWLDQPFAAAKAAFEAEDPVTILWDRGGRSQNPGAPESTGVSRFTSWPPKTVEPTSWFAATDGVLAATKPTSAAPAARWTTDVNQGSQQTLPGDLGGQAFWALPDWQWKPEEAGRSAVYVTEPLAQDVVIAGPGSADLWIRSSQPNADLSVTLSEVRSDGREEYVQSGFLRARIRKEGPDATALNPDHSGREEDSEPLPVDTWTQARVPMLNVAHVFRAGSRIRVSVHTPGGDKPRWAWILDRFEAPPVIDIGNDAAHPTAFVLPVVPDASGYVAAEPDCVLRGQPCRPYVEYHNESAPTA
jgi:predicted acyl esterase